MPLALIHEMWVFAGRRDRTFPPPGKTFKDADLCIFSSIRRDKPRLTDQIQNLLTIHIAYPRYSPPTRLA